MEEAADDSANAVHLWEARKNGAPYPNSGGIFCQSAVYLDAMSAAAECDDVRPDATHAVEQP